MLSYKDSGVDIEKSDFLTDSIKKSLNSENIGMFAGLCEHPYLSEYYFAACADGVGTKIIPLIEYNEIDIIANDLIAMNLNDLICVGAKPIFFLDYLAINKLDVEMTSRFINSLKSTLNKYNCQLIGGETSELNDMIKTGVFDVGGFAVGLVKKDKVLRKETVKNGDVIIGLVSNGIHSNGFTLVRKLYKQGLLSEKELKQTLKPTYIYVNEVIELLDNNFIKASANITGGGLYKNLNRVIPKGLTAQINKDSIPTQNIFEKLKNIIGEQEAYNTFNMGVGMCLIASDENVDKIFEFCSKYNPFILGKVSNS